MAAGAIRLAPLMTEIQVNLNGFRNGLDNAVDESRRSMSSISNNIKKIGKGLSSAGETLTKKLTVPIIGATAAAFKFGSDFEENVNKVSTVFQDNTDEVMKWSKTTLERFGIAQVTALDMASLFGDMATSMGLVPSEAAEISMALTGLAGDIASFKNKSIDEVKTALNGIFTGETESLKGLGIVMTETNLEAFALSQGIGKTYKEMTEAEKVSLRYQYVLDKTSNSQGDFAKTSDGAANQVRIFQEGLKELATGFGREILPIITPFIQKLNEMIKRFGELDPETKQMIVKVALLAAALGPVLLVIGKILTFAVQVGPAISGFISSISAGGGAIAALSGPVGLAIAAVVGLFIAFKTNFAGIRDSCMSIFSSIKDIISTTLEAIKWAWDNNFLGMRDLVMFVFNIIKLSIGAIFEWIAGAFKIFSLLIKGDWDGAWNAFCETVKRVGKLIEDALNSLFEWIGNGFTWFADGMKDIGKKIISKLKEGIKEKWSDFTSWVDNKMAWLGSVFNIEPKIKLNNDGRHFNGLNYVPFDGYNAVLHKGERVLTAEENRQYNNGALGSSGGGFNLTIENFNNNRQQDIRELIEEIEFYKNQLA